MSLKKTKAPIMGLAALLIIVFHLMPVPRHGDLISKLLAYTVSTAYIGVDIFFFLSGYMSYYSDTDRYIKYVKRKFLRIYPIFALSCIIYVLIGRITIKKALLTLIGYDLFVSGGGSFLWFIPAIMIFYMAVPVYIRLVKRFGKLRPALIALALWCALTLLAERLMGNHSANIFLCRIPVIILGISAAEYEGRWKNETKLTTGAFLFCIGIFLTWKFCAAVKLRFLISDIFYIIAIPQIAGILLLSDVLFSFRSCRFFEFVGSISLELYCFQMLFGSVLFQFFISSFKSKAAAFASVLASALVLSYLASLLIKGTASGLGRIKNGG